MKKKWLEGMAALLSTVLLVAMPGLPVKADNVAGGGLVEVTGTVEPVVRSVSGGDAEIIYPAPGSSGQKYMPIMQASSAILTGSMLVR